MSGNSNKSLGGALYLTSAENRLVAGFSAEGGKLSFAGTGATGLSDALAEGYVSAGTLEFTAPTEFASTLHVRTPTETGAFAPGGTSVVETGTLKLGAGAVVEGVKFAVASGANVDLDATTQTRIVLSGAGTVANGTLASPTFGVAVTNEGTVEERLTLGANATVTGETLVDLGRTYDDPVATHGPIAVLNYAGAAPDVSGWKLRSSGIRSARGRFTAANGTVSATIEVTGLAVIFR